MRSARQQEIAVVLKDTVPEKFLQAIAWIHAKSAGWE